MSDKPGSSSATEGGISAEEVGELLAQTGASFAVVPLSTCPHLTKVKKLPGYELSAFSPCSVCDLTKENWICLTCYSTNCSRFVNQHAEQHFLVENHPMAISISDFSVWCYECNSYVHNEVLFAAKNALNKSKFGNDENTNVI